MKSFLNIFYKIFGYEQDCDNESYVNDDIIQNTSHIVSEKIFDNCDPNNIEDYLKNIKTIYEDILDYLENTQNNDSENETQSENYIFSDETVLKDKYRLKIVLSLIANIANNHNRSFNLITKIENIIKSMKKEIQNFYSNEQVFNLFKKNQKLLLFLFKEEIILPDKQIFSIFNNHKYQMRNYPLYFYPEFKSFFTDEFIKKYKIDKIDLNEFDQKREIGENEHHISQLIRTDSIDEFIIYVTKNNLSLNNTINSSVFETNEFLVDKTPTFLEYATFFGSIQIFQYIKFNNIELTPSLWLYAIHGKNPEIIHLLEENYVFPSSYTECLSEAIKCHHNEIKNYLIINYPDEIDNQDILPKCVKYFNFIDLTEEDLKQSETFYYLCKYNYCQIVKLLLNNNKNNEIDINWQKKREKNKTIDDYEYLVKELRIYNIEIQYHDIKTPLITAVENRYIELTEILLQQQNINVNLKFNSSFHVFSDGRFIYIFGGENKSILFIAAEKGYSEIVQLLINRKDIDVNEMNETNDGICEKELTVLHMAIENELIEITRILLSAKKINTNCIESNRIRHDHCINKAPLSIAIEKENIQIIQLLLLKKETDLNQIFNDFYSYRRTCIGGYHEEPYKKLTPLQLAIEKENKEIIQILLNTKKININEFGFIGLDPFAPNECNFNQTALHMAVEKNNIDITKMLLSYDGINVNSVANYKYSFKKDIQCFTCHFNTYEEKTALSIAVEKGNLQIIEILLKNKKINKNIKLSIKKEGTKEDLRKYKTTEKIKILDIAIKKGNRAIIDALQS